MAISLFAIAGVLLLSTLITVGAGGFKGWSGVISLVFNVFVIGTSIAAGVTLW